MSDLNVYGDPLIPCCAGTGFQRNGYCAVVSTDYGNHSVCAIVTDAFLTMQQRLGNDLITPNPAYQFAGLKPGDKWCLCASRWLQAHTAGVAPPVVLAATSAASLNIIPLAILEQYSADKPS